MKYKLLLFTIIYITIINITCDLHFKPKYSLAVKTLPHHHINLDLSVRDRYKEIFQKTKENIHKYVQATKESSKFLSFLSIIGGNILNKHKESLDNDWIEYQYALAKEAEISLGEAVMLSMTYDIACTSVIVQNAANDILMGRNLDFGTSDIISKSIFVAEYYRNDQLIYKGIELIGFRGGINAIKPNAFSISINLRYDLRKNPSLIHLYRTFYEKRKPGEKVYTPNYAIMKAMENAKDFDEAEKILSTLPITSPAYYALAGVKKNEGVIITRSENIMQHKERLDVDNGKWYLVVCNKDLNLEGDVRREFAENNLKKITREKITRYELYDYVMKVYPTLNNISAYTSIHTDTYFNTHSWIY